MASNSRSKANSQARKMMNNFIESLDLVTTQQYTSNNAYARKAMQSQGTTSKSTVA